MTDSIIDMNVVEELLEIAGDDDPELLLDLIDMFLEDAPIKVDGIAQGMRDQDLEAVERAAHSLKGSSGNLGAGQVQELADALQIAGREQDSPAVERLVPELQAAYSAAESALKDLRVQYSS